MRHGRLSSLGESEVEITNGSSPPMRRPPTKPRPTSLSADQREKPKPKPRPRTVIATPPKPLTRKSSVDGASIGGEKETQVGKILT